MAGTMSFPKPLTSTAETFAASAENRLRLVLDDAAQRKSPGRIEFYGFLYSFGRVGVQLIPLLTIFAGFPAMTQLGCLNFLVTTLEAPTMEFFDISEFFKTVACMPIQT